MICKRFIVLASAVCMVVLFVSAIGSSADETRRPASRRGVEVHSSEGSGQPPDVQDVRSSMRQQIARYRSQRSSAKQRAEVLNQLAALGDEGVTAAKDLLQKDIHRAEMAIRGLKKPPQIEASIDKFRKTLFDLRKNPDLSKDELRRIGLPAIEALNLAYQQRTKWTAAQNTKIARSVESLRQTIAVLRLLSNQRDLSAPLQADELLKKAHGVLNELAPPEEEQARAVLAKNQAMASQFPGDVRSGMDALNTLRMTCGLLPLLYDAKLYLAARGHCRDMQTRGFFAHESPVEGKKTPWDRARLADTTAAGENIYMGSSQPAEAMKAWFLSPGHHKNMLSESARRQGLGREGAHWTLMLGDGAGQTK